MTIIYKNKIASFNVLIKEKLVIELFKKKIIASLGGKLEINLQLGNAGQKSRV
jgi:hypothetical protein